MKITADRKALVAVLDAAAKIIPRSSTIPILSNLMVEALGGRITVTSTNLDMFYAANIEGEIEAEGAVTLPGHMVRDIVKRLPEAPVSLDATDPVRAVVTAGRSRFRVPLLPASDFPQWLKRDYSHSFTLPGADLARMIERCSFAMSTEETRYYLNGIYFSIHQGADGPRLHVVATDGHRLAMVDVDVPEGAADMPGVILPRQATPEIARMAATGGDVTVSLSSRVVEIALPNGARLATKVIDGTFPDYLRLIPVATDRLIRVSRASFAETMERIATIADRKGTHFAVSPGRLRLTINSPDNGDATEDVDVETDVDIETGLNARYVRETIEAIGGDTIELQVDTPGTPVLFRPYGATSPMCLIMPMRW